MSEAAPFNPRLVVGLLAAGLVAFAALLLLLAFGDRIGDGRDARAQAIATSATGFKGLVTLVGAYHDAYESGGPDDFDMEDLLVVAVQPWDPSQDLAQLLERRHGKATMIILPKWLTVPHERRRGWVRALAPGAAAGLKELAGRSLTVRIAPSARAGSKAVGDMFLHGLRLPVPHAPQVVEGPDLEPMVTLPGAGALVARLGSQPHYLVSDPDLLNNHGLRDPHAARGALALIRELNATGSDAVAFDLAAGARRESARPSLLRTALEPPFLMMTIGLVVAALLAGLHGANRFGQPRPEARAIALGKAALVENSAGLVRLAGREAMLGAPYAEAIRQEAARAVNAPAALAGAELDAYLDRRARSGEETFSTLAERVAAARDRHQLVAAARALFAWRKDIIR